MGYMVESWHLAVTLDSHAGDKERRDAALWEELRLALEHVAGLPQFAHMVPYTAPDPAGQAPAVRWRAVLALLEAAQQLAAGEEFGGYVDTSAAWQAIEDQDGDCARYLRRRYGRQYEADQRRARRFPRWTLTCMCRGLSPHLHYRGHRWFA